MNKKVRFIMGTGPYKDGQVVELDPAQLIKYSGKYSIINEEPPKPVVKKVEKIEGGK